MKPISPFTEMNAHVKKNVTHKICLYIILAALYTQYDQPLQSSAGLKMSIIHGTIMRIYI